MNTIQKSPILFFTLITLLVASLAVPMVFANPITVSPNQETYATGEKLSVTGTATPNAQVSIQIKDPSDIRKGVAQTQADDTGAYSASDVFTFVATSAAGAWTVTAYDSTAGDTASAILTVGALKLTSATVSIVPDKTIYGAEAITITISGNTPMSSVSIVVTQSGASQVTVGSEASVGDTSKWGGTYMIMAGKDGTATIDIIASDASGNQATAIKTFAVSTGAPVVDTELAAQVADLDDTVTGLESDVAGLESDVAGLESDITALTNTVNNISPATGPAINAALVYGALIIGIIAIAIAGVALARKK
jgi:hypothetical protein